MDALEWSRLAAVVGAISIVNVAATVAVAWFKRNKTQWRRPPFHEISLSIDGYSETIARVETPAEAEKLKKDILQVAASDALGESASGEPRDA